MIPNDDILPGTKSCLFSQNLTAIYTNQTDFDTVNNFFVLHLNDRIDYIHARISVVNLGLRNNILHIDVYVGGCLTDI